ncbi:MAG: ferrous iron transport protein B [Bacillota bacterium]
MGLTSQSTGFGALKEAFQVRLEAPDDLVVALAGNPNTGKSTIFNSLTGLRQHTGNWPGKTVTNAQGRFGHRDRRFVLVDLPGTYSLLANSVEEEVARDFICFGQPHVTAIVTDATCLERNLNLVLQILEITSKVVVCVNLLDEAKRKHIQVDLRQLASILGVPVVGTSARDGTGLGELKEAIYQVATGRKRPEALQIRYEQETESAIASLEGAISELTQGKVNPRWIALRLLDADPSLHGSLSKYLQIDLIGHPAVARGLRAVEEQLDRRLLSLERLKDGIVCSLVRQAEQIASRVVTKESQQHNLLDRRIDSIVTSTRWGIPIMLGLLGLIFWITIVGANYPSGLLARGLFWLEERMTQLFSSRGWPQWLHGLLVQGIYRTSAWVVAVMLPPMAIFFPLFTLLEDLGYLPRVAFNLDNFFRRACAHGKQALTMCMGFGCNAAGVIACRIIDSPRERLIAMLTNNFVPCNGRFPTLIALASIFIVGGASRWRSALATMVVLAVILLGVLLTLFISRLLSRTLLRGLPSSFALELPPYRKPQVGRILIRSLLDRTLFVLGRAVSVAAPAGLVIWLMANLAVGENSLLQQSAAFLQPFAQLIGLDGYILLAFILGLPANEIVIPIVIMSYLRSGTMLELASLTELKDLLVANGWTWLTAVCTMLFSLCHWPCGTTLLTIRKEAQSWKWAGLSLLVPTVSGIAICFLLARTVHLLGLV